MFNKLTQKTTYAASYSVFKKILYLILLSAAFLIFTSCSSIWSPSDEEAVKLVHEYYLYYNNGEQVEARILEREAYDEKCKCYPIKFDVSRSTSKSGIKTFYFVKNGSGKVSIKQYAYSAKNTE